MFHGTKKKEKKALTQEEEKKVEEQLYKIKAIQNKILEIRDNKQFDSTSMEFLLKAALLMPDCPTLWNNRKLILQELMSSKTDDEIYAILQNEIKSISPIMIKNPKSYMLWHHRIWNLTKAADIERKKNLPLEESVLMKEIALCNSFLESDDRNFHCWNYRIQIFILISQFFANKFDNFLEKELKLTMTLIKKNFSNFSAWHYRSKLIPIYFQKNAIDWNSSQAMEYFREDLEYIKNATYTDPKDQSPWNYHLWIINNLTPIVIQNVTIDSSQMLLMIKYSHIFKIKDVINSDDLTGISLLTQQEFSDCLILKLPQNEASYVISNKSSLINTNTLVNQSLLFNPLCFTRLNVILPKVTINVSCDNVITYSVLNDHFSQNQTTFLTDQIAVIDDLIKNSDDTFLEYAHYRKTQLLEILFYIQKEDKNIDETSLLKENIASEYTILASSSKRMKRMYLGFLHKLQ